jgi:hypothetical protein
MTIKARAIKETDIHNNEEDFTCYGCSLSSVSHTHYTPINEELYEYLRRIGRRLGYGDDDNSTAQFINDLLEAGIYRDMTDFQN